LSLKIIDTAFDTAKFIAFINLGTRITNCFNVRDDAWLCFYFSRINLRHIGITIRRTHCCQSQANVSFYALIPSLPHHYISVLLKKVGFFSQFKN